MEHVTTHFLTNILASLQNAHIESSAAEDSKAKYNVTRKCNIWYWCTETYMYVQFYLSSILSVHWVSLMGEMLPSLKLLVYEYFVFVLQSIVALYFALLA